MFFALGCPMFLAQPMFFLPALCSLLLRLCYSACLLLSGLCLGVLTLLYLYYSEVFEPLVALSAPLIGCLLAAS